MGIHAPRRREKMPQTQAEAGEERMPAGFRVQVWADWRQSWFVPLLGVSLALSWLQGHGSHTHVFSCTLACARAAVNTGTIKNEVPVSSEA